MNKLCDQVSELTFLWSEAVEQVRSGFLSPLDERSYFEADFKKHFDKSLIALKSGLQICQTVEPHQIRERSGIRSMKFFALSDSCVKWYKFHLKHSQILTLPANN